MRFFLYLCALNQKPMVVNARTFVVQAVDTEQENVLKAFFNALKIKFEVTEERTYNQDFVNMVLQAEDGIRNGKGKKVTTEEFDNLWK
jgi:hypothetical protein